MARRSHSLIALVPVIVLGAIGGIILAISERPLPLGLAALAGCIVLLLALTVLRDRIIHLFGRALSPAMVTRIQSPAALSGLVAVVFLLALLWVLWPSGRLWVGYSELAGLAALFRCAALRVVQDAPPDVPAGGLVPGARWGLNGLAVVSISVFMGLAPGDLVHGVGGASDMGASEAVAKWANGVEETLARIIRGQQVTHGKLDEVLQRLDKLESVPKTIAVGSNAPSQREPLSDEDRAIFDEAKPSADALTRYRIAVAEGDDAEAARLEQEVERLIEERQAEENFHVERARGDRH
ncbi:MAG: hypothetical protein IH985_10245, partial [Planctomycetes bacterium]|nr:hypothetical protein [Planctomycetota bacterium]